MNSLRRILLFCVSTVLVLALAASTLAQVPSIDPGRLPQHTVFYVLWRGAPAPAARSANSLYALWDDPDFAPARNAIFDSFMSESRKSGDAKSRFTREEISEYTALLDNPLSIGFVSDPTKNNSTPPKAGAEAKKWEGFFFIYDRSGKEALLAKALLRIRAIEKDPATITPTTIAGVPAMKMVRKSGTDYWVETGKYIVSSGEISVVEQILNHLRTETLQSETLASVPEFKEAGSLLAGGILEYFVNVSDIAKLANDAPAFSGMRAGTIMDTLKVNAVHSIAGRVVLDGSKTRFRAGFLGDASEGTLFDIWDAGQAKPASIAYIPPGTVSYRETQLNLPGIYALAMRVTKSLSQKGEDNTNMIEAVAQMKLGMSSTDALHSLTGEFGFLQTDSRFDFLKSTFFVGVRNRDNALKLLRHVFIDEISADTDIDGDTFLTLSMGKKPATPGSSAENNFDLVVTKDMILVASKKELLRAPLAQRKSATPPSQLAPFFAAHTGAPAAVNGLSFLDFQKFDWQSLKSLPFTNSPEGKSAANSLLPDKAVPAQKKTWLDEIDPKVFSRHLHLSYGYSWKDANGIHLEGWFD